MNNLDRYWNLVWYWYRLVAISLYCAVIPKNKIALELLGNTGASWWIPSSLLTTAAVVYSGGVGEDVSFDQALIAKYGCSVFAFDPTPRSVAYVKKNPYKNFYFYPLGLWRENRVLKFFAPSDTKNVSHSIVNLQKTTQFFKAPCLTIRSIMNRLHHSRIDLLKLDIEGAEFAVLDRMFMDKIFPKILALEFDQPKSLSAMIGYIEKLQNSGYRLIKQDHFNFTFIYIKSVLA